ncbi:MAG: hypothetical protein ABIO70_32150 [Pseudomonadota bacterium]
MRLFHAQGLTGFRFAVPEGPWPFVVPGSMLRSHQDVTTTVYQNSVAPAPLSRIEIDWLTSLQPADEALLDHLRRTGRSRQVSVVVNLLDPEGPILGPMAHPLLAGFPFLVIVVPSPGGSEPLAPLYALDLAVRTHLEERYDELVSGLSFGAFRGLTLAPDLRALDAWWGQFEGPVDAVQLVNQFIAHQAEGLSPQEAADLAAAQRVSNQLAGRGAFEVATLIGLLQGRLFAELPFGHERGIARLVRQRLWDPETQRPLRWASHLGDRDFFAKVTPFRRFPTEDQWAALERMGAGSWIGVRPPGTGWTTPAAIRDLWESFPSSPLWRTEESLRALSPDPVRLTAPEVPAPERAIFLLLAAAVMLGRGEGDFGEAAFEEALSVLPRGVLPWPEPNRLLRFGERLSRRGSRSELDRKSRWLLRLLPLEEPEDPRETYQYWKGVFQSRNLTPQVRKFAIERMLGLHGPGGTSWKQRIEDWLSYAQLSPEEAGDNTKRFEEVLTRSKKNTRKFHWLRFLIYTRQRDLIPDAIDGYLTPPTAPYGRLIRFTADILLPLLASQRMETEALLLYRRCRESTEAWGDRDPASAAKILVSVARLRADSDPATAADLLWEAAALPIEAVERLKILEQLATDLVKMGDHDRAREVLAELHSLDVPLGKARRQRLDRLAASAGYRR